MRFNADLEPILPLNREGDISDSEVNESYSRKMAQSILISFQLGTRITKDVAEELQAAASAAEFLPTDELFSSIAAHSQLRLG